MEITPKGIAILRELEGVSNRAYKDAVGYLTIGVGHMLTRDELYSGKIYVDGRALRWAHGLTDQDVDALLKKDLYIFEQVVSIYTKVALTNHQFDALVSFSFNIGMSAFMNSTLLRRLNEGRYEDVPAQLRRWNKAGGVELKGLKRRREIEIAMWEGVNYG